MAWKYFHVSMLIAVVVISTTVHICDSGTVPIEQYMRFYLGTTTTPVSRETLKTQMCRTPNWDTCSCKPFQLQNPCRIVRWYFEENKKICRPLCTEDYDQISSGVSIAQISPDIMQLFKTKLECENLCGMPCVVTFFNHTTLRPLGVCMDEIWCDIFPHYPDWMKEDHFDMGAPRLPCPHSGVNCCPKNYFRSFPHHPFLHP